MFKTPIYSILDTNIVYCGLPHYIGGTTMKQVSAAFLLLAVLAGCATNAHPPVVPSLEGKPRIQVNKQVPPQAVQQKGE